MVKIAAGYCLGYIAAGINMFCLDFLHQAMEWGQIETPVRRGGFEAG